MAVVWLNCDKKLSEGYEENFTCNFFIVSVYTVSKFYIRKFQSDKIEMNLYVKLLGIW